MSSNLSGRWILLPYKRPLKEGSAANRRRYGLECNRFETRCQQWLFTVESPLKCTLPLVICMHNINSCVRPIGWLDICFTCERCYMTSLNKRSTFLKKGYWRNFLQFSTRTRAAQLYGKLKIWLWSHWKLFDRPDPTENRLATFPRWTKAERTLARLLETLKKILMDSFDSLILTLSKSREISF